MYFTVYRTVNKIDGKIYIGQHKTKNLDDDYLGSGKMLHRAIKKHGIENFEKEILFVFDNEQEMNAKEAELVTEAFCKEDTNYNLCPGGQGGWGYLNASGINHKNSAFKSSEWQKIFQQKAEQTRIKNSSNSIHIQIVSDKISTGLKLYYNSGGTGSFTGKLHSDETKAKMSLAQKDKHTGNKNSQFGSMWITNGIQCTKIKKNDIIPEGWYKGRIMKRD